MNHRICSAIRERRMIKFSYDGGTRFVEPYCYGISTAGNEVLRAFQIKGFSRSGPNYGWRLFNVAKISGFRKMDEFFEGRRAGYDPNDSAMTRIHCHI